jgi:hypothetical protein
METMNLEKNIRVFGREVKTFPARFGEEFDASLRMLPDASQRSYDGIGKMDKENKIVYRAMVEEKYGRAAEKYHCGTCTIEKEKYSSSALIDWYGKTLGLKINLKK